MTGVHDHPHPVLPVVGEQQMIIVEAGAEFTLADGHPMRSVLCLNCRQVIGREKVTAVGLMVLAGSSCVSGCIGTFSSLIHAACYTDDADVLAELLKPIGACTQFHPWDNSLVS